MIQVNETDIAKLDSFLRFLDANLNIFDISQFKISFRDCNLKQTFVFCKPKQ